MMQTFIYMSIILIVIVFIAFVAKRTYVEGKEFIKQHNKDAASEYIHVVMYEDGIKLDIAHSVHSNEYEVNGVMYERISIGEPDADGKYIVTFRKKL